MTDEGGDKKSKPLTFAGLTALAMALDSKQAHTSFGNLPLSVEKTEPKFGFPQAKRDDGDKIFMGEISKKQFGKVSPGPIYDGAITNTSKYKDQPKFGFGTAKRDQADKPKYDFYENGFIIDDPEQADLTRKPRCTAPKIGTEPRMPLSSLEQTPGPQYYPKERPEVKNTEKFSFGYRREGAGDPLKNKTATPNAVGPGRYAPELSVNPSTKKDEPKWTLPKAGRPPADARRADKNQTYDTRSGFGGQVHSKNKTQGKCTFGKADRGMVSKLGSFQDHMTATTKVKLYHPTY